MALAPSKWPLHHIAKSGLNGCPSCFGHPSIPRRRCSYTSGPIRFKHAISPQNRALFSKAIALLAPLSKALESKGYDTLTPVQEAVTKPSLMDRDLLVSAQTGSGKTVGFGLAIAPTVLDGVDFFPPAGAPLAVVIAPTRELALQVKRELGWLYAQTGAQVASTVGGMDMRDERRSLERGTHMVVATPGRLRDHIQRGSIDLSEIRAVVLDEADEMLDLGFREDLEFILEACPESRRTLMFSATVPRAIATLAQSYQKNAERVMTSQERTQHADIVYRAMPVMDRDAENAIINVLRYYDAQTAIVFGNTRATVNRLTTRFSNRGFSVVALSGELTQSERANALQSMRDGRARVCVATDVAARGIDLPNLELVIHAELPSNHETLLHRSGRTGRAGRKGVSAMIVPVKFRKKAERLLKFAKLTAEWGPAPSAEQVLQKDRARLLNDPVWTQKPPEMAAALIAQLVETYTPQQLASAYVQLFTSKQSAPEDLGDVGAAPAARAPFGPSAWFSVSIGRQAGADPRRLLPMLCRAGDITRDDIGAIRIQNDQTYVEILQSRKSGFLKAIGEGMTLEDGVVLTELSSAPDLEPAPSRGSRPNRSSDRPPNRGPRADRGFGPDRTGRPDRGAKPNPAAAKSAIKPKSDPVREKADARKPHSSKNKSPHPGVKSARRQDHGGPRAKPERKTEGFKPGDTPDRKKDSDRPRGKPTGKADGRKPDIKKDSGKSSGKVGGKFGDKFAGKSSGTSGGKRFGGRSEDARPAAKPRTNAMDTSKRFVPPSGAPNAKRSQGGKPKKTGSNRGGDAPMTRK